MKFSDLAKLKLGEVLFKDLGPIAVEAYLFNVPQDQKYYTRVEFKFGTKTSDFSSGSYGVALNSLVDLYFEQIKNFIPPASLSLFLETEDKLKQTLKAELSSPEIVGKVQTTGYWFKKPVVVLKPMVESFLINIPSSLGLYSPENNAVGHSISLVSYEVIVQPRDRGIRKKLGSSLGKEFH